MRPLKANKVINGLTKKGFQTRSGDHVFLILYVNGKKTSIYTKVSHGGKEIGDHLLGEMAWQLKLEKKEFVDLVECPMTEGKYISELQNKGYEF